MKQQSNWWLFRPLALVLALAMALTCLAAPALAASIPQRANAQARKADQTRNINFDNNWYFRQTDARTPAKPVRVTLPHDAMIHGTRSAGSPGSSGVAYFDPGMYEYTKTFNVPAGWKDKHVLLRFDGVYRDATVYLNGKKAAYHAYGYTPFSVNCDPYLQYGGKNTVRVIADNSKMPNSRWYSGAGIYRDVFLDVVNKTHIAENGVRVTTQSISPAKVTVATKVDNPTGTKVAVDILDGDKVVARGSGANVGIAVPDAKLWSAESPHLYTARVRLLQGDSVIDEIREPFGIRSLSWSNKGLLVNGKNTLLRGGCIHPDNGILGAVSVKEAEERKIKIMKENGFNAIRSAHNPASKALLDACDKYGMYVMDETFDMWYKSKNAYDYGKDFDKYHTQDISAMINHDYNHPSVIMYSIGNEVSEPAKAKGVQVGSEMIDQIHREDPTRPVTAGLNLLLLTAGVVNTKVFDLLSANSSAKAENADTAAVSSTNTAINTSLLFNALANILGPMENNMSTLKFVDLVTSQIADKLDIVGYNYGSGRYARDQIDHPNRVVCGSETFPPEIYNNWQAAEKYSNNIGDFMWAGWDYLGESGVGAWSYDGTNAVNVNYPWLIANTGVIDIQGTPGAEAAYNMTVWHLRDKPYIGVRPVNHQGQQVTKSAWRGTNAIDSWSWKGCEGNDATVEIYSDKGTQAELFVNGKSVGRQPLDQYKAVFETKYEPGNVKAVVYDQSGNVVGENQLSSASGDAQVVPSAEAPTAKPGEVAYIDVNLLGTNGVVESNADRKLKVTVENGELLGFGSANPKTAESFVTGTYTTYYGRALAAVRCGKSGKVTFHVTDTTTGKTTTITIPVSNISS